MLVSSSDTSSINGSSERRLKHDSTLATVELMEGSPFHSGLGARSAPSLRIGVTLALVCANLTSREGSASKLTACLCLLGAGFGQPHLEANGLN